MDRTSRLKRSAGMMIALGACASAAAGQGRSILGPAAEGEIESLARDLGDPVYATREFATRRLCVIGSEALDALRRTAEGDDVEASLRAKKLLAAMEQLYFSGVDVHLELSKSRIDWNEPVDLVVTLTNRSTHGAKVPFEARAGDAGAEGSDARQVGDLLDAAEWLKVRTERGREIELRVDDIAGEAEVLSAVQARLDGGPASIVAPGERRVIRIGALNRGWARFPLLESGEYVMVLEYAPEWLDPVLAAHQVGRVRSNEAKVTVVRGAPAGVSRGGAEAELSVEREGAEYVARMTNRSDLPLHVNVNFGTSLPFAEGTWVVEAGDRRIDIAAARNPGRTWRDFEGGKIETVEPGASVALARIGAADVEKSLKERERRGEAKSPTIGFAYSNFCDRRWQERERTALEQDVNAPEVLKNPLPRRMLSTRMTSNRLELDAGR